MGSGKVSRGEKMAFRGSDPESYITEYTLVYEDSRYTAHGVKEMYERLPAGYELTIQVTSFVYKGV